MTYRALSLGVAVLSLLGCSESAWLRVQKDLRGFQKQANAAIDFATDPRTKALFGLCADSALKGIQKADDYLKVAERVRQAKKQGISIPELDRALAQAMSEAEDAEATARKDCATAKVSAPAPVAPATALDAAPASDLSHPADSSATPTDAGVRG